MVSDGGFKIYRCFVTALIGLILIGAGEPPKTSDGGITGKPKSEIQVGAETVSVAIREPAISPEKDRGCQDQKDKRDSDLCAQWKAADAATDAAQYALWTLLMSAVGTALLVWTLWETREASRRELRAYVKFSVPDQAMDLAVGKPVVIKLQILNYGHTPACNASFQHACGISEPDWMWSTDHSAKRNKGVAITLHRDAPVIGEIQSQFSLTKEAIESVQNGKATIFARGTYFYDDVFGRPHVSQVSLEIRGIEMGNNRVRLAPTGNFST